MGALAERWRREGFGRLSPTELREAIRQRVASDPSAAAAEAEEIHRLAQEEKSAAKRHRRRSRYAMAAFLEFKQALESMGVTVILEPGPEHMAHSSLTNALGGTSDHRSTRDRD